MNRILKDGKDLDMRLKEKNPGKEELSVMTQVPFLTTAPQSLGTGTRCLSFVSFTMLYVGPYKKEFNRH